MPFGLTASWFESAVVHTTMIMHSAGILYDVDARKCMHTKFSWPRHLTVYIIVFLSRFLSAIAKASTWLSAFFVTIICCQAFRTSSSSSSYITFSASSYTTTCYWQECCFFSSRGVAPPMKNSHNWQKKRHQRSRKLVLDTMHRC